MKEIKAPPRLGHNLSSRQLEDKDDNIEEPAYQCPGEADQISFAVHRARLEAGWPGCADCIWNDQLNQSLETDLGTPIHRAPIRRTPFGVRGAYLNAIDRTKASMLASIFVSHLSESEFDRQQQKAETAEQKSGAGDLNARLSATITTTGANQIIVGYDTDSNSPNLFAGVVQAVRQTGADVIDIGCCSAASLQYSIRRFKAVGGVVVTSASALSGEIGFDVFDRQGQAVSVPWQKYGIRVRLQRATHGEGDFATGSKPQHFAQHLRRQAETADAAIPEQSDVDGQMGELILPDSANATMVPSGRRRHSGRLQTQSTEADYRNSVLKWWGQPNSKSAFRLFCRNEIVTDRIEALAAASSVIVEIHEDRVPEELIRTGGLRQPVTIEIEQDDRFFRLWSRAGRRIEISELIEWLNQRLSRTLRHVTAHAADPFQMIRLLDMAGPDSGESFNTTVDAVAIVGLLLSLNEDGRHPLPA